ncbi:hypothetical protein [Magnetospira thiophila]
MENSTDPGSRWSGRAAIGFVATLSVVGWLSISAAVSFLFPGEGGTSQMANDEMSPDQLNNLATAAGGPDCMTMTAEEIKALPIDAKIDPACSERVRTSGAAAE